MPARKVQDERELVRWYREGRTGAWVQDEYRRKYGVEVSENFFSNAIHKLRDRYDDLEPRVARYDDLLPWRVREEHLYTYPAQMLRMEGRRRAGEQLAMGYQRRLDNWLGRLRADDLVVHYDPDTDAGFMYVPRRAGIDTDVIRDPRRSSDADGDQH